MGSDNTSNQPKRRRCLALTNLPMAPLLFVSFVLPFFILLAITSTSSHRHLPDARRRAAAAVRRQLAPALRNATMPTTRASASSPLARAQAQHAAPAPVSLDEDDDASSAASSSSCAKCPRVNSITPRSAPTAGGIVMTIIGRNLGTKDTLSTIRVGGVDCVSVESVAQTEAHCRLPEGTGARLAVVPVVNGAPPAAAPSSPETRFSYVAPRVHRLSPAHAPNSGGGVITIQGVGFGKRESFPIATVGGLACTKTTWISDTAVRCVVPKGVGARLAVHVTVCGCGEASSAPQSSALVANSLFSYDEDAMRDTGKSVLKGALLEKFDGPLITNRRMIVNEYEGSYVDPATQKRAHFAIPPEYATVVPLEDWKRRHETCAVVGNSGSLVNGKFGEEIDRHAAVFRLHNAPTHRFEADVGSKTTYQLLDQFWSEQLMANEGGPQEARWLIEDSVLVFWSPQSQEAYIQMRQQFPASEIVYLSFQFLRTYTEHARRIRVRIDEAMNAEPKRFGSGSGLADIMSSGWYATALALQLCKTVDVYGMDARTGKFHYYDDHDPGDGERERSSTEYLTYLAMQSRGLIRDVRDAVGAASLLGDGADASGAAPEPTPGTSLKCQKRECVVDCNGRGEAVNGTCQCEPIYSGNDCSVDRLRELAPKLLDGVSLRYNESLLMHKGDVNGTNIALPEGITKGKLKEGDNYKVDRALYHTLPDHDLKEKWGTCAVLGNSGQLLSRERGREIDAHDVVYRFNQAPVKGYEQYVGSRSSHESLNGYWVKQLLDEHRGYRWNWRSRDTSLVLFEMFEPSSFVWKSRQQIFEKDHWWKMSYARLRRMHPDRNIIALSPKFVSWAYLTYRDLKRKFQRNHMGRYAGEKPMSGFYAVLFLLQVCDEVDIYGFNPYRDGSTIPGRPETRYHYFDSAVPRPGSHSFDLARYIYQLAALTTDRVRIYD